MEDFKDVINENPEDTKDSAYEGLELTDKDIEAIKDAADADTDENEEETEDENDTVGCLCSGSCGNEYSRNGKCMCSGNCGSGYSKG